MAETNASRISEFWDTLYSRDFDKIATFFADDATYTDIATPPDDLAVGPEQIVARLRLGIEPISEYRHGGGYSISEGDFVITEHKEIWGWHTGESVTLPFVSVHELRDLMIVRWTDYWDLTTLLNAAPAWWVEQIAAGYL